jgi:hypothetical protein
VELAFLGLDAHGIELGTEIWAAFPTVGGVDPRPLLPQVKEEAGGAGAIVEEGGFERSVCAVVELAQVEKIQRSVGPGLQQQELLANDSAEDPQPSAGLLVHHQWDGNVGHPRRACGSKLQPHLDCTAMRRQSA